MSGLIQKSTLLFAFSVSIFLFTTSVQGKVFEPEPDPNPITTSLEKLLEDGTLETYLIDRGIERSDRLASVLLFEGEKALSEGNSIKAIRLGEMAEKISPFSPAPSFFMAGATWQDNRFDLVNVFSYYLGGMTLLFEDFLSLVPLLSPLLLLFLLAILMSVLTLILYSLFVYAPVWIHQISEYSRGYLQPIPAGLLFVVIFFAPLLIGLPILWFLLFSFIIFWGFYNRAEKGIVLVFIVGLGVTTWVLPFFLTLFTLNDSILIDEMSRNYRSDYQWAPPRAELSESEWEGWFIRASYEAQRGQHKKAMKYYKTALEHNANSPIILNNLGNLSYYLKNYRQAVEYYQKAIEASPSLVSAHYNLGQSYREMLLFEKGEMTLSKARAISTQTTQRYAMKAARFPDYPVIDERFTKMDLWSRLLTEKGEGARLSEDIWQGILGEIPLENAPLIAMIWVILLVISGFCHKILFTGGQCAFCKKAICSKCAERIFSYKACRLCVMRFVTIRNKSDFSIIEDAVKKIPARLYPIFLVPGGGHLAIHKTKTGFFILSLFYLLVCSILIGDLLIPPTEWYLHFTASYLPKALLVVLCAAVFIDLTLKRRTRQWL